VILQLQDRIIKLDREMDQLLRDKELYLRKHSSEQRLGLLIERELRTISKLLIF
jgi:hypothetical protein